MAEKLTAFITSQGLKPGDRLPTEHELAASFGVSRLSLREATKALEFLGIVEAKPGCGLSVGADEPGADDRVSGVSSDPAGAPHGN